MNTGHLKCEYLLVWVRNMQNCEMPKTDIFLQVRGHENLQIFRLSGKSFKMMKITTRWTPDTWNVNICSFGWEICKTVKCPKLTFFCRSAVMKIFKFFDFLESLLKWWKSPSDEHWTLEMWIFACLGEKYSKLWNVQNWHFFAGPRSWKSSNFSTFCGPKMKIFRRKSKGKVQVVPQSQTAALLRPQEEEETDKSKQAQTE